MSEEKVIKTGLAKGEVVRVETTLGDLICAISEAAEEAEIEEKNLASVTTLVLRNILYSANKLN